MILGSLALPLTEYHPCERRLGFEKPTECWVVSVIWNADRSCLEQGWRITKRDCRGWGSAGMLH
jgi:hypothetical protein